SVGGPVGLYEPVHGSAPDIAGKRIANPLGAILSAAMLLRHSFQLEKEAVCIEKAVSTVLQGGARTADIAGKSHAAISTGEMGSRVVEAVKATHASHRAETSAWVGGDYLVASFSPRHFRGGLSCAAASRFPVGGHDC